MKTPEITPRLAVLTRLRLTRESPPSTFQDQTKKVSNILLNYLVVTMQNQIFMRDI